MISNFKAFDMGLVEFGSRGGLKNKRLKDFCMNTMNTSFRSTMICQNGRLLEVELAVSDLKCSEGTKS